MRPGRMLLVGLLACAWSQAEAAVLCAPQSGEGTVKVRASCKANETLLDPVALGLQGPPGPPGPQGPPGTGLTGSVVSVGGSTASSLLLFTTPATGVFLLTQFCTFIDAGSGRPSLRGNTFGEIPGPVRLFAISQGVGGGNSNCVTYTPGIALPPNEELFCDVGSNPSGRCVITGILNTQ